MVQPGGEALNVALSSAAVCATSYAKHSGRMHCHCSKSLRSGIHVLILIIILYYAFEAPQFLQNSEVFGLSPCHEILALRMDQDMEITQKSRNQ